ncbi:hypothetical protein MKD41_06390 [Lutibacter sp. A64]|nr:hypothetical protein [Lutibacter sp. A64]UMB55100.1 hypothetical protein MKD41_06390 [Lutibacter sp. A64]
MDLQFRSQYGLDDVADFQLIETIQKEVWNIIKFVNKKKTFTHLNHFQIN